MRLFFTPSLLLCTLLLAHTSVVQSAERPNIVILFADDLGYADLSSFGAPDIQTPAIDSIGKQGLRFTHFYSNSPECSPSRAALLTGRHPQRVGGLECAIGIGNVGRYDEAEWLQRRGELGLPPSEITIAELLRRAGYDTAIIGKWHLGYAPEFSPRKHGFTESLTVLGGGTDYIAHTEPTGEKVMRHNDAPVDKPGYLTDVFVDHAVEWLNRKREGPYFLYLPFNAPHDPYQEPGDGPLPVPWPKGTREKYRRMVEHLDKRIGDLLAAIDRTPSARNTIVVFLSDNGGTLTVGNNKPLRGGKTTLWEGGIRVPCLLRWPAAIPAGRESNQVSQSIDLTATLATAAGIVPPTNRAFDGIDLLNVWRGAAPEFARTLYWRYKRGDNRRRAVLDGDLKLIIDNDERYLVDVRRDPTEKNNLLAASAGKASELDAKLAAWEREVAAPRLRDFRPPQGSASTDSRPSGKSP